MPYKVVRKKLDGTFWSVLEWAPVQYEIDKPTRPAEKCGPLACFASLQTAQRCIEVHQWGSYEEPIAIFQCHIHLSQAQKLWNSNNVETLMQVLPAGTILADEVTLIEQVSELIIAESEGPK